MALYFYKEAEHLADKYSDVKELVGAIQYYLQKHFEELSHSYEAHSILESRFIPPEIAFDIGMKSCGSVTNIAVEMLRHVGYEVKKVNGSTPMSKDHAWISVKNSKNNVWEQYDLTRQNCEVTSHHEVLNICDDWEDIAIDLEKAHIQTITKKV